MEGATEETRLPEDIISIMVASDIHLGHAENDPVRGDDSFIAFEEVLSLSVEYDADMLLLGGDLFDHAKPSPAAMHRAVSLLRRYCLGARPVALELLSDAQEAFGRCVNYEDPDLNVALPVLSIHGNHDDPVGAAAVSALDILATSGLVNYFGRWADYSAVRLRPVLLRKGATRLALYGLGHLKDQRLARLFRDGHVTVERPPDGDNWFNVLVLHQNRADRGHNNYIPESVLPAFLDLVVWGHEHDCRIQEEFNGNFHVSQPGSTVATSLSAGEALPKHCALLQVHLKKFTLKPVPLGSVRPFVFRTIVLSEVDLGDAAVNENEKVQEFLKKKVQEAAEEAALGRSGHPRQPELPLVRLSVFYQHEGQDFNRIRFGQNFNGVVANPNDVLMMKKERRHERKVLENGDAEGRESAGLEDAVRASGDALDVAELLRRYYLAPDRRLAVLSATAMAEAVADVAARRSDDGLRALLAAHVRRALADLPPDAGTSEADVAERLRLCRDQLDEMDEAGLRAAMTAPPPPESRAKPAARGRGRGRGKAAPAPPSPPSPPASRRTPRRSAARNSPASWLTEEVSARSPRVSLRRFDDAPIHIDDSD